MINNYYVYRYIRLDTDTPFYIGASNKTNYARAYDKTNRTKAFKEVLALTEVKVEIILDSLSKEDAEFNETNFISKYGCLKNGGILVNVCKKMSMPTDETKQKMGESQKGNINGLGKKHTEESKKRMSESRKGVLLSEAHKQKISYSRKGMLLKEAHKQKISESKKGIKIKPFSEAHKQKLSNARKGIPRKPLSEATKKKISDSKKIIKNNI